MSAHEILSEIRSLGGRLEARGDRLHIEVPAGAATRELKARLADGKAELLKLLALEESGRRLEAAHISIAVWEDGTMRVIQSESDALAAIDHGGTIYNPADMLMYVTLSERERRMLHAFKRRFGGNTAWKTGL